MHPTKIWANLAVTDLKRTTKFYTDLGFTPNGAPNEQLTSFLFGENEFVIHFFLKEVLGDGMKGVIADAHTANEIIFTLGAANKDDVDTWAKEVEAAGGNLISQPETFGKAYYGFVFADPDGHRFNVFYM
ncbi:VOC family protein [Niabella soli]|uniref:Glyoxalase n=1 Tax=Niabella soli DSM 19437 TaxID=929713 RepID=W0EZL2_9BACT|nr:VOC family protein [Niabella soli]AHF14639.1 glyoxalase [Niabella soli DSM 19437]